MTKRRVTCEVVAGGDGRLAPFAVYFPSGHRPTVRRRKGQAAHHSLEVLLPEQLAAGLSRSLCGACTLPGVTIPIAPRCTNADALGRPGMWTLISVAWRAIVWLYPRVMRLTRCALAATAESTCDCAHSAGLGMQDDESFEVHQHVSKRHHYVVAGEREGVALVGETSGAGEGPASQFAVGLLDRASGKLRVCLPEGLGFACMEVRVEGVDYVAGGRADGRADELTREERVARNKALVAEVTARTSRHAGALPRPEPR